MPQLRKWHGMLLVTSRKGRVSRNFGSVEINENDSVTSRKGRVSRNCLAGPKIDG